MPLESSKPTKIITVPDPEKFYSYIIITTIFLTLILMLSVLDMAAFQ
jgi:hypothetical protein